jgi:hypothetical protein
MEQVAELEEREELAETSTEDFIRKELKLEWVESEWFQVWLKLARGEGS